MIGRLKMIKHIFCDLDGTLFNNGISKEDIKAIEEIEKEGIKFHVATGRVFKQAYNMVNNKFPYESVEKMISLVSILILRLRIGHMDEMSGS